MLKETKYNDNLKRLLEEDRIYNLNIIGIIENSKDRKIYVDDENKPSGVLVNDGYFNYMYTNNDSFLDTVIKEIFQRKGEYGFSAVKPDIAKKIKEKYEVKWHNPCVLYYHDQDIDIDCIKTDVRRLEPEDAKEVDKYYTYRDENSIYDIKHSIENRETSCIYKDGELASWLLIHDDNSLGPMYTKKEYRKEGYAVDVTLDLVNKIRNLGKIPFLHIVEDNVASHRLAKKCGFKPYNKCEWFGVTV